MANEHREPGGDRSFVGPMKLWIKLLLVVLGPLCVVLIGWEIYCRAQLDIGRREWARLKVELESKGEKLDWKSFLPKPVPDGDNFIRTPFLEGLGYRHSHNLDMERRLDSRNLDNLAAFLPDMNGDRRLNLEAMVQVIRSNTVPASQVVSTNAATAIIQWFEPLKNDFDELRAASLRPYAQWRVNPTNGFSDPIPDFVVMRKLSRQMAVLAGAFLADGQPALALEDLRVNLRLAGSLERHATLVAVMIAVAIDEMTVAMIREGLEERAWNDAQLAGLENLLRRIDLPAAFQHSMRCERAAMNQLLDANTRARQLASFGKSWVSLLNSGNNRFLPLGWFLQSVAEYDECVQKYGVELYDDARRRIRRERLDEFAGFVDKVKSSRDPRHYLVQIGMPNFGIALVTLSKAQTRVDEARIAIALERYRIRNGQLPDDLSAVVPDFLNELPHDLIDGQPLHYRRLENVRYALWSVGWNGIDEKGKRSGNREKGDWVWTGE